MWLEAGHLSTSVPWLELEPIEQGSRFTHVEHGVFFDQLWAEPRDRQPGAAPGSA
ncbi:hypothetical protein [Lapillicoccus sp.]|uniref:hypothetical protein n=1 Tax=Lapillicoccus sp. TaxID=1909287 RepID=UPI0032650891